MRLFVSIFLVFVANSAFADAEMSFNDGSTGLISNGKVLFGDSDTVILYEDGQDHFIVLNHGQKTYMRMDKGFAKDVQSQVNAEMEKMLAGLPEAQRAMAEEQMKSMMPQMQETPEKSLRRTGDSDEVANFDCEIVEVVDAGGAIDSTVCVASQNELGLSGDDYQTLKGAMKVMQEMAEMSGGSSAENDFDRLGGVPIRSKSKFHSSELVSFDTSAVDSARLSIPADYTEVSLQDMMRR